MTEAVRKNRPSDRKTWPGQNDRPTTLSSRAPWPRYWVCFWNHSSARWTDDSADQQARQQHDVEHEQAAEDPDGRELPAEEQRCDPWPDERDREHHRIDDPQARAGQEVVGERVAGDALAQREGEQPESDQVVELARSAERTCEEDPGEVGRDGAEEHQGRPVVDLAHQEARLDPERDVHDRGVGGRHRRALERRVGAVVRHRARIRRVEQGQERAGREEHDEREQRDLAEQEAPVVREHLAHRHADGCGHAGPAVEPPGEALELGLALGLLSHRGCSRSWGRPAR